MFDIFSLIDSIFDFSYFFILGLVIELMVKLLVMSDDCDCQIIMCDWLWVIGFQIEYLCFGEVDNFWVCCGVSGLLFVFVGYIDVVFIGLVNNWEFYFFELCIENGMFCGCGVVDMKGSLVVMVIVCEWFVEYNLDYCGFIGFLIISDEEGFVVNGMVKVVEYFEVCNEKMDWCLVGEFFSIYKVGDVIKNGCRGLLGVKFIVKGIQGYVVYLYLVCNLIYQIVLVLDVFIIVYWDNGNEFFLSIFFQIFNFNVGIGVINVILG